MLECLLRRRYEPAELLAAHPPRLRHPHKRLVFELACPPGAGHGGSIELTRWAAAALPETRALAETEVVATSGYYEYETRDGVWHVNFASGPAGEPLADVIERITQLGYEWGVSDGN